jgi:hypothetical protein
LSHAPLNAHAAPAILVLSAQSAFGIRLEKKGQKEEVKTPPARSLTKPMRLAAGVVHAVIQFLVCAVLVLVSGLGSGSLERQTGSWDRGKCTGEISIRFDEEPAFTP